MRQEDRASEQRASFAQFPDLPRTGYAREAVVLRHIPFGRSTLWRKSKLGEFPAPIKLSERVTAWRCEDLWRWMDARNSKAAA